MSSNISSKRRVYSINWEPPRPVFYPDSVYIHYDRLQQEQEQNRKPVLRAEEGALSSFTQVPVDIFYEIVQYLHPQDMLSMSRSTHRLRQLLMTHKARFVWKSALSNTEGLPTCPLDLSEPQFASLAFDEHCHICLTPRVKDVLWSCRVRACRRCLSKCFLTIDDLIGLIPNSLMIPNPETIFLYTFHPKAKHDSTKTKLFYKPLVEAYLRELIQLDANDDDYLPDWCIVKRIHLDTIMAHSTLCERWASYWSVPDESHYLYDLGFTLCLLGLLVFLWKDKLIS